MRALELLNYLGALDDHGNMTEVLLSPSPHCSFLTCHSARSAVLLCSQFTLLGGGYLLGRAHKPDGLAFRLWSHAREKNKKPHS